MARYNADGTLDTSFGTDDTGCVSWGGGTVLVTSATIDAAGDNFVCGTDWNRAYIWKFTSDGALDTSFGDGGGADAQNGSNVDGFNDVAIEANGDIVAVGVDPGSTEDWLIARYTADGTLDTSFADGVGWEVILPSDTYYAATEVAVQASGKILVGRQEGDDSTNVIVRLNTDGSIDETFGPDDDGMPIIGGLPHRWISNPASARPVVRKRSQSDKNGPRHRSTPTPFHSQAVVNSDYAFVCHSQGCNILLQVLLAACDPRA